MQRVFRSSFVGLLTIASLAACGDKVTIPQATTATPDGVVHSVTVSPAAASVDVGKSITLAASVDAGAGVTVRTVTWSSSDATVASVVAGTGVVTGVKAGTATIIATSAADVNVKGAAAITVGAGAQNPTVTISAINQNNGVTSIPANLGNAFGQLDVVLNVEPNGQTLKTVSATLTCGTKSISASQTVSDLAPVAAEAAAVPITLSFNTAAFNATTGVPALNNGACTISAVATTAAGTQSATNGTQLTLNNQDGVVISSSFVAITNAEGVSTVTSANDAGGLPWRGGAVTVSGIPVLYSGRTIASVSITLPGANTQTQTVTTAPFSATWSATSTTAPNVTRLTLVDAIGCGAPLVVPCLEANGFTPKGVTPTVVVLDANGNDLGLTVLNSGVPGQTTFRVDNTPPQPATTVIIPGRQSSWVNASYTFTGTGGTSFGAAGTTKYVACGDGAAATAVAPPSVCAAAQSGVSNGSISSTSGVNGLTTFTYYAMPALSYAAITGGTSTSGTTCSTTGWTKITTAGDLAESSGFNAYVVRVFETDKLGNTRCNDLANLNNLNNSTAFVNGTFGVDKVAPTATIIDSGSPACIAINGCVSDKQAVKVNPVPNFFITYSDNASGFSTTPISTQLTRLAIDPATNAASTTGTLFGCPIGFSSTSGCTTAAAGGTIAADAGGANGVTSNIDGYYTYTGTVLDLARNAGTVITRQVVVDRAVPVMGGIAVPATVVGGQSASFATSATDNLDLVGTNYTLSYVVTPAGGATQLNIRANGPAIGVAFDNVLTTASSFSLAVPFFVRNVAATTAAGLPTFPGVLPTNIAVRVTDGAGNVSLPGTSTINAANVPQTGITNFTLPQASTATFNSFAVTNVATNISNCPTAGCTANAAPVNPTSVLLTASAIGSEGATFQFLNPFASVQFYYLDAAGTNEWILIGSSTAPSVTDNAAQTLRTFTWGVSFDPPAALPVGAVSVIAVGVNTLGDALVSANNALITLTNP